MILKTLSCILFSFLFLAFQELPDVRKQYYNASKSKQNADQFYELVSTAKGNNVLLAYEGAAITLKSKFASGLKSKKQLFIQGVTLVETAVKDSPDNTEIRLIRLSIQEHTPKLLKNKEHIEGDKKQIISAFDKLPQDLKEYIKDYVKQSKVFTEKEKQHILN